MVIEIKSEGDFDKHINNSEKLVVADFSAKWCGPCQYIAPEFEKLSENHTDVDFLKVDGDQNQELTVKYSISAYPAFLFFRNGKPIEDSLILGANKHALEDKIKELKLNQ